VLLSRKEVIELADLPPDLQGGQACEGVPRVEAGKKLADMEREAIQRTLLMTGGNRQRTAEILGIRAVRRCVAHSLRE
jgi:transcriptional regulator of acetoin/glycerol metabolism